MKYPMVAMVMIVPIMGHLLPFIGVRPETLMGNLPGYIDAHVTSQVLVGFFTLEVFFSRIHMTFAAVFGVVFDFIFAHDVTSWLGVVVWLALKIHPKRVLAMGTGAGYNKGENLSLGWTGSGGVHGQLLAVGWWQKDRVGSGVRRKKMNGKDLGFRC